MGPFYAMQKREHEPAVYVRFDTKKQRAYCKRTMETKTLSWDGCLLVNGAGECMGRWHMYGDHYEGYVYKNVDPQDETRGTSRSKEALVKAVGKFGYTVNV